MKSIIPNQVIKQVVKELSKSEAVAALVLTGSQVKGAKFEADQYSDIELYVVAYDESFKQAKQQVRTIQNIFKSDVVLAYENQWAGWSILFKNLLRLEIPLVRASNKNVFSRPKEQKIKILYQKPGFKLKSIETEPEKCREQYKALSKEEIKDFWYMTVYAAQHIARGEIWLAREAVRISLQKKVKSLIELVYYPESLVLDPNKRIEQTWNQISLKILKETSSAYNKVEVTEALWANLKYAERLIDQTGADLSLFRQYQNELLPQIKAILKE